MADSRHTGPHGSAATQPALGDLTIFKLLFFRPKELLDIERMVAVVGERFNRDDVREALVGIVGADEPRIDRWRTLLEPLDRPEG